MTIKHIDRKTKFRIFLVFFFLISLLATLYYTLASDYPGVDYYFHLRRFNVLIQALSDGQYPFYIDTTLIESYGYNVKSFYPDLILLPFAFIGIFTGALFAYNLMLFTATFLCGVFTYKLAERIYNSPFTAVISAILFTFCLYRMFDIYHRAALGEILSFTFVPIVFLGLYEILKGDYKKWYILTIGISLMIYTHLISSVLIFILILLFCVISYKSFLDNPKRLLFLILSGLISLPIVASYIIPMLEQISSNSFKFNSHVGELWRGQLAISALIKGLLGGIVFQNRMVIYGSGIGVLLFAPILLRFFVKEKSEKLYMTDIIVIIGIFLIFTTTYLFPWSSPYLQFFQFIQFPWRWLEFSSFSFAIAGGFYLSQIVTSQRNRIVTCTVVIILSFLSTINYINHFEREYTEGKVSPWEEEYLTEEPTIHNSYYIIGGEYLPAKVPSIFYIHDRGDSISVNNADSKISRFKREDTILKFTVNIAEADSLTLPLIYYKGYTALLNNKDLPITQSTHGLIQIPVNETGNVKVYYEGTIIQKVSFGISILAIFALCIYILIQRRKKPFKT
ncbi:6-pyruvoyl-tetrahydropterin synthase-related protein [Dysgonomonas gadei]|uniref:Membrane protein 6-pyruvoyl-tetrahydropterin synthase-related domain-containing protein n=1 Tax=Dysgonomonas gadei ATCC BAA-286 TaxID=742766 RepID=F5J0C1_9BACT|nr:6-pyruvoyl-tetrahydropterin synthase-related protein [Dysgonomonas gadei]EGK00999.1 hypothetical protein HMPREF9455_02788 [Dysgonomonas gadei ATCC BAA-286]